MAVSEPEKKEEHAIKRANPTKYKNIVRMFTLVFMIAQFGDSPQGAASAKFDQEMCV